MPEDDRTEALLRAWHSGDRDALSVLIDRDRAWILAHLHERRGPALQRDADTLDHFQDLMVEVLDYAPRFLVANRAQFRRLVATMIHNLLADRARRIARRRPAGGRVEAWPSDGQLSLDPAITAGTAPAEAAARQEELGWLRLGLEFLADDDRTLVQSHTLDGRTFVELGAELELPANTVRMRCHRAMLRLAGIVQRLQAGQLEDLLAEREAR